MSILIDYREKPQKREKAELRDLIIRFGVKAEIADLPFADIAFEGYGGLTVGIERKRLHDMLGCIDDSRFSAHQRIGLRQLYNEHWLMLEGIWRPHDPRGLLMQGDERGQFWELKVATTPVMYSKLRRYLFSVVRSGTPVMYTRSIWHTAYDIVELYHYYQKKEHRSMLSKQQLNIPSLTRRPALVKRWAMELDGVDIVHGDAAEKLFRTPIALAMSEEVEWLGIPGIGPKTAGSIVQQIAGMRRER